MVKKKKNILPKVVFAVVILFLGITIAILNSQIKELEKARDELYSSVKEYSDRVDELKYEGELSEREYIEKYAREVLGFHKTGEIVFKNSNGN
ncbi:MAG: septum formation initiator family protein [Clostridia bacterium]|nr:septum formation initiator family protein [Clostridia bacterium]